MIFSCYQDIMLLTVTFVLFSFLQKQPIQVDFVSLFSKSATSCTNISQNLKLSRMSCSILKICLSKAILYIFLRLHRKYVF